MRYLFQYFSAEKNKFCKNLRILHNLQTPTKRIDEVNPSGFANKFSKKYAYTAACQSN